MPLSRKSFLIGSMAVAAAGARRLFAVPAGSDTGTPRLKLAVLSDIHVRDAATQALFIKALEWYRAQGVDAVLVAGDMADHGLVAQLKLVADAWFQVFPDNKTPEGRPVAQLFEYGNHDVADWKAKNYKDDAERALHMIRYNPKKQWETYFHEAYQPVFAKEVKGYTFIGSHWPVACPRSWPAPAFADFPSFMKAKGPSIDPNKPFFYFQHPHPKDTCYGPWAWGHDNGDSTQALMPFPNAIALSGHSHYSLTDERTIWQGAFTSLGTSSLSYTSLDYNFRENAGPNNYGTVEKRKHLMPRMGTSEGHQGMLFSVYDDHICIARREFNWGESLGDDWILPVGKGAAQPYTYAKRRPVRTAPEFAANATVKVAFVEPKAPADPKAAKPEPTQVEVTFPAALTQNKCRVFEYEIQAVIVDDDVEMVAETHRVMATDFHLPQSKTGREGRCVFDRSELPAGVNLRFDVTPIECFGHKGRAIHSTEPFKV